MGATSEIRGVEVFAAGEHRPGKGYGRAALDAMVENFQRNKESFHVPVVIGHGEDQKFLEDSGLPAAAWVKGLRRVGGKLVADFSDVPPEVMRLIRGKRYRTVSAEVYDEPPKGLKGRGHMLRRVALLGGMPPEVKGLKSLDQIPLPDDGAAARFAESRPVSLKFTHTRRAACGGTYHVFSEVVQMNRDEMIQKLGQAGLDTAALEGCGDEALAEMLRFVDGQAADVESGGEEGRESVAGQDAERLEETPAEDAPAEEMPAEDVPAEEEAPDEEFEEEDKGHEEPDGDEEAPDYDKFPKFAEPSDEEEWAAVKKHFEAYRDHCRKYAAKFGEAEDLYTQELVKPGKKPEMYSERAVKKMIAAAVADELKGLKAAKAEVQKFNEDSARLARRKGVNGIIERLHGEGRLPPSQHAAARALLLAAADVPTVHKFSEGGKAVERSLTDLVVGLLDGRTSLFSEALPAGEGGEADPEELKVEAKWQSFSESYRDNYRSAFGGKTMTDNFRDMRQANPKLKADDYLKAGK